MITSYLLLPAMTSCLIALDYHNRSLRTSCCFTQVTKVGSLVMLWLTREFFWLADEELLLGP